MSYVRARQNSLKNVNVESMYQLVGGRVEALEFIIKEKQNIQISRLRIWN